jgi:signal transduction histidine kinase/ligand-binding sensor domain-containing protein
MFSLFSAGVHGLTPQYHFNHYSIDDGLSQVSVNAIVQDELGFMWIGTQDGLNRFDGHEFVVFKSNPDDTSTLSNTYVTQLLVDSRGRLWVGTVDGLNLLDPKRGVFQRIAPPDSDSRDAGRRISALAESRDGTIWVGSRSGVLKFDHETVSLVVPANLGDQTRSLAIEAIAFNANNNLLVGTREHGVLEFLEDGSAGRHWSSEEGLPANWVASLLVNPDQSIWVGTRHPELSRIEADGMTVTRIPEAGPAAPANAQIRALAKDQSDRLWSAGIHRGVGVYEPSGVRTHQFGGNSRRFGIGSVNTKSLFVDRHGEVWIGTYDDGLYRFDPQTTRFQHWAHTPESRDSLSHSVVWSIQESANGDRWIGTSNGLNRVLPDGEIRRYRPSPNAGQQSTTAILVTEDARNWVAVDDALYLFDAEAEQFLLVTDSPEARDIQVLMSDRFGQVWGGGISGLFRLDPETHRIERFLEAGLADKAVYSIVEDSRGRIWIGTLGQGVYQHDPASGELQHVAREVGPPSDWLSDNSVISMLESPQGTLWIGTLNGLNRLDLASGSVRRYYEENGLPNNVIYGLLADGAGQIWMSTNKGIARLDPQTNEVISFSVADGLQENEFNTNAYHVGPTGTMYFGGPNGVTVFEPDQVTINTRVPRAVITDIQVANQSLSGASPFYPPLFGSFQAGRHIVLEHDQPFFSFTFAALGSASPQHSRFSYRLIGFDDQWVETSAKRRNASFTNIGSGNFWFEVRARSPSGAWSQTDRVQVTIDASPWRTAGAFLGYLLVASCILLAIAYPNIQKRREHKRSQAEVADAYEGLRQLTTRMETIKEDERQRISRELHDELGQNLTAAKINLQVLRAASDDETSVQRLNDTIKMVDQMIEQVRNISLALRPPLLDEAGLVPALNAYLQSCQERSGVIIDLNAPADVQGNTSAVRTVVFRVVQEAVNNALRHARATEIQVRLSTEPGALLLSVRDDGQGFDATAVAERVNRGEHLGLLGMAERVRAIGGEFSLDARPGVGSLVEARIPRS